MQEVVIIDAVRSPIGKRGGGLSNSHSVDLLGAVQSSLFTRTGVDPKEVGQVVGDVDRRRNILRQSDCLVTVVCGLRNRCSTFIIIPISVLNHLVAPNPKESTKPRKNYSEYQKDQRCRQKRLFRPP